MTIENDTQFEVLKSRLQQDPDSLLFARIADGLLTREQIDEAIGICEEGIRKHPYYVTGHMVLGKCYLKKKLFDLAEKEFKRVILFDPKYIAAHRYYGDLMREVGWDNTCEMSYRKILSIDPLDSSAKEMLETLERIKPKEKEIVTPEYIPEEQMPEIIDRPQAEQATATSAHSSTEPINLDDDLFSETGSEETFDEDRPTQSSEADENVITTILEDIFDDDTEEAKSKDEDMHDTIDELNIKISPRRPSGPVTQEQSVEDVKPDEAEKPGEDDLGGGFDRFEEDTIEFNEIPDIGSETTEHMRASEDFEIEFITAKTEEEAAEVENMFDALDDDNDDLFQKIEAADEGELDVPEMVVPSSGGVTQFEDESIPTIEPEQKPVESGQAEKEEPEPVDSPASDDSLTIEREKIVTPTLGEIYAAQGQYAKAINVFELLLKKDPANPGYQEKISFLQKRLEESQNV